MTEELVREGGGSKRKDLPKEKEEEEEEEEEGKASPGSSKRTKSKNGISLDSTEEISGVPCPPCQRPFPIEDKECIREIIRIFEGKLEGTDLAGDDPDVNSGINRILHSQWVMVFFSKEMEREDLRSLYDSILEASKETNELYLTKDDEPTPLVDITKIRYQTRDCEFKGEGNAKKYSPEIRARANCWNVPLGKFSVATSGYDPEKGTFWSDHAPEYYV